MGEVRIILPYPPTKLNPNDRAHWRVRSKLRAAYRDACNIEACAQVKDRKRWTHASIQMHAYVKFPHYKPDPDNFLASMKAGIDGLADAGVFANDLEVSYMPTRFGVDKQRPRVEVTITEAA